MRRIRSFMWVHPDDCDPPHGLDMQSPRDYNKVAYLRAKFEKEGFDKNYPALVGYPLNGKIQLMSGTHRHEAAKQANILLPVTMWLRSDVQETWGTDLWPRTLADIPVKELETWEVVDGFLRSPYDPVELT